LYTYELSDHANNKALLQKFSIPFVKAIIPLIKNFVVITTIYNYLGIFQLNQQQGGKVQLEIIKDWVLQKSYFIREVVENMI
jgi:hypothetical protein